MHLKVFVKLKKTLKTLSSGQKNPKNPKKNQKTYKTNKKPTGLGLKKKNPGFFQPWDLRSLIDWLGKSYIDPLLNRSSTPGRVFTGVILLSRDGQSLITVVHMYY
jgi:hypothetical protein